MRKRHIVALSAALAVGLIALTGPVDASAGSDSSSQFDARAYKAEHGYLPLRGVATLQAAKAHAARTAPTGASPTAPAPLAPAATVGASWGGVFSNNISPPDPNGAIGPHSYIEIINRRVGIYTRTGAAVVRTALSTLTGVVNNADPVVLWDPDTQRFYYNVLNVGTATMDWGFSKTDNPTSVPGGFCNYESSFGYSPNSIPDYPKLGQTKDFLLIGVNFYPDNQSDSSTSSDVLWISKPQGTAPVTTCPAASSFGTGKMTGLLAEDGSQAFTPMPAIQTDPSSTGYVVTMSDIECPPSCFGTFTTLSVFTVTPNGSVPQISGPTSIVVGSFQAPPNAPQQGTSNKLDTLDGRITHAVSGFDPAQGTTTVWTAHTVKGGRGSEIRWYEVDPTAGSVVQSGAATSDTLWVLNAGISNDRTCTATACAHGDSMALGFTTTSVTTFPTIQMVTKVGANPQSAFVIIKKSTKVDKGFSCSPCRWGDYGGATPDPAVSLTAAHGSVWLSNQWTKGGNRANGTSGDATWNWEVRL